MSNTKATLKAWPWIRQQDDGINKVAKRVKGYSPDSSKPRPSLRWSGRHRPIRTGTASSFDGNRNRVRAWLFPTQYKYCEGGGPFEGRGRPPKHVTVTSDGYAVTGSRDLKAYDRSGNIMRSPLPTQQPT